MTFKTGDKGKTRNGHDYEIIYVLNEPDVAGYSIVALKDGAIQAYLPDGSQYKVPEDSGIVDGYGLLPPRQKIEGWVNIYEGIYRPSVFETRQEADLCDLPRVACVPITIPYTEGEGL